MKHANEIVLILNYLKSFSFASSFAEIKTFEKSANAVYQWFSLVFVPFSFADSFAATQTSANKRKPVYQVVTTRHKPFLCKSSLQNIQLRIFVA